MLLYHREVFSGIVLEDSIIVPIQDADYLTIYATSQVVASGGSNTLTVELQHSFDGVNWATHTTPINANGVSLRVKNVVCVGANIADPGGSGGAARPQLRLVLDVGPTNSVQNVSVTVTGRIKKTNPVARAMRAAQAAQAKRASQAEKKGDCGCSGGGSAGAFAPQGAIPPAMYPLECLPGQKCAPLPPGPGVPNGSSLPPGFNCAAPGWTFDQPCAQFLDQMNCADGLACFAEQRVTKLAHCKCNPEAYGLSSAQPPAAVHAQCWVKLGFDDILNPAYTSGPDDLNYYKSPLAQPGSCGLKGATCAQAYAECRKNFDVTTCKQQLAQCMDPWGPSNTPWP